MIGTVFDKFCFYSLAFVDVTGIWAIFWPSFYVLTDEELGEDSVTGRFGALSGNDLFWLPILLTEMGVWVLFYSLGFAEMIWLFYWILDYNMH